MDMFDGDSEPLIFMISVTMVSDLTILLMGL